jgi:uncharacterized membrane protein
LCFTFAGIMITEEEKAFLKYWEENRLRKKKVMRQLSAGLPMAVVLVVAIFANFFSGWYKRAAMIMGREGSSLLPVLLIASLLIVVFVIVFSVRHRWDLNEQRYLELRSRKNEP